MSIFTQDQVKNQTKLQFFSAEYENMGKTTCFMEASIHANSINLLISLLNYIQLIGEVITLYQLHLHLEE